MAKTSQIHGEGETGAESHRFIVYFLNDDEDQSVQVEEVEEPDFFEIIHHLNLGGSVYITHRKKPKYQMAPKTTHHAKVNKNTVA